MKYSEGPAIRDDMVQGHQRHMLFRVSAATGRLAVKVLSTNRTGRLGFLGSQSLYRSRLLIGR